MDGRGRGRHETAMEWPADMSMDEEHRRRITIEDGLLRENRDQTVRIMN
jgi:hypothetical protein